MSETETEEKITAENAAGIGAEEAGRVYELGYLLLPTLSEENAPAVFGNLKELIVSLGGDIISSEMPRMIRLAYVMTKVVDNVRSKFDAAYFGWIKFELEAEALASLKKRLDLDPNLIRFLITKTVRENTLAPKKFAGGGSSRLRAASERKEEKEEAAPINEKEIDEEIDALVEAAA